MKQLPHSYLHTLASAVSSTWNDVSPSSFYNSTHSRKLEPNSTLSKNNVDSSTRADLSFLWSLQALLSRLWPCSAWPGACCPTCHPGCNSERSHLPQPTAQCGIQGTITGCVLNGTKLLFSPIKLHFFFSTHYMLDTFINHLLQSSQPL